MNTTKLSSKGQVIIPKPLRTEHHWEIGQELVAINFGDGILLKPKKPFDETHIENVAGSLKFKGKAKTIDEMNEAIAEGMKAEYK